jgi:hypothetical protein
MQPVNDGRHGAGQVPRIARSNRHCTTADPIFLEAFASTVSPAEAAKGWASRGFEFRAR